MRTLPISKLRRGVTLIECLVAGLILAMSMAAMVSMWYVSFNLTSKTDTTGIAYNVGRQEIEQVRETGFGYTAEGTTLSYYDANGVPVDSNSASKFYVATTYVVSSAVKSGTAGDSSGVPADSATRLVFISVARVSATSTSLYSTNTYLVRNGI